MLTKQDVEQARQNKLHYIVEDIMKLFDEKYGVDAGEFAYDAIMEILFRRGVSKWFSARRKMIALKDTLKTGITALQDSRGALKEVKKVAYSMKDWRRFKKARTLDLEVKGSIKVITAIRQDLRMIAHGPRLDAADNDLGAQTWLNKHRK